MGKTVERIDKLTAPATPEAHLWNGYKSHGLKPAYEPIIVAMKPNEGSYAENALKWGVAGINVDGGRIPLNGDKKTSGGCKDNRSGRVGYFVTDKDPNIKEDNSQGRFPANIILDEESARLLDEQSGKLLGAGNKIGTPKKAGSFFGDEQMRTNIKYDNGGYPSRFFYCAKASKAERNRGCEGLETKEYNQTFTSDVCVDDRPGRNEHNRLSIKETSISHEIPCYPD